MTLLVMSETKSLTKAVVLDQIYSKKWYKIRVSWGKKKLTKLESLYNSKRLREKDMNPQQGFCIYK